jgi:hypothetical protein
MKEHVPQLLPAPKGKTFRQKMDKEAEPFQQQILEIANQPFSFLNPKLQTPHLPAPLPTEGGAGRQIPNKLQIPISKRPKQSRLEFW